MVALTPGNTLNPEFDPARFWALVTLALANLPDSDYQDRAEQAREHPGLWVRMREGGALLAVDWPRGYFLVALHRDLLTRDSRGGWGA